MHPWKEGEVLPGWHPKVDIKTGIKMIIKDEV